MKSIKFSLKSLIITLIFIQTVLTFTCFNLDESNVNVCNSNGKCIANDKCSCFSGFGGIQCETKASESICTWNTPSKLKTDFYPKIDNTYTGFSNDNLKIGIKSPLVKDRLQTEIFIENENDVNCKFPGQYWSNSLIETAPCSNDFKSELPWSFGKSCGWNITDTDSQKIYSGNVYVKQIEKIGELRGTPLTRSIKSVIPMKVKFQKNIEVEYKVQVFAPIQMEAAIIKQEYIPGPPSAGNFEFITQAQYPFMIDNDTPVVIQAIPSPITTNIKISENSPICTANQPCTQNWEMPIVTNGACSFTGLYQLRLKLKCHSSITDPANCPLGSTPQYAVVQIEVNSENFCTVVNVDIKLKGDLKSYEESSYTTPKNAFLQGQIGYFKATVSSEQATLLTSKIRRASWTQGNSTKVFFDEGLITPYGTLTNFLTDEGTSTTCGFNFKFSEQNTPVPLDESRDFSIKALIEVTYASIENQPDQISFFEYEFKQTSSQISSDSQVSDKFENQVKLFGKVDPLTNNGNKLSFLFGLCLTIIISLILL
jgi:hypothetical protein